MSAQEIWRLHQGLWSLVSGQVKTSEVEDKGFAKAMAEAGRTRTAQEALDEYNIYRAAKEREGLLVVGITSSFVDTDVR